VVGKAYIIHSNPEQRMEEVPFDIKNPTFIHDGKEYDIKEKGLFYGFTRIKDRLQKRMSAASFYDYGVREPRAFDAPLPQITAEVLKMMGGETATGQGLKSLKSARGMRINWKWILVGIVAIVIIVVLFMYGPQLIEKIKGAV
jgi:hypothetical protein